MKVIVDRIENDYAVVEIEEGLMVNLPKVLVPDAKEGDIININIAKEDTQKRKENINNLMNDLFN